MACRGGKWQAVAHAWMTLRNDGWEAAPHARGAYLIILGDCELVHHRQSAAALLGVPGN